MWGETYSAAGGPGPEALRFDQARKEEIINPKCDLNGSKCMDSI